ncbi:hypothetical protein [Mycolicibacterium conceptionense]|uniref:hypothetical protein n=1 Tax=Mycolicibacterium conceptionense TaxID=451644 RepID=UPI000ADEAAC2|nr:hypothetical protein [Mycolicibacterium conceptionense]
MSGGKVQVHRDGQPVSEVLDDENAAYAWLHRHQSASADHALRYEGYSIEEVQG